MSYRSASLFKPSRMDFSIAIFKLLFKIRIITHKLDELAWIIFDLRF